MQITKETIVEFVAIQFTNPDWEFGAPCFLLKPITRYHTDNNPEQLIDDCEMDLLMGDEIENDDTKQDAEWNGTSMYSIRKAARDILAGKATWHTKHAVVVYKKIRFYYTTEDEIESDVLEIREERASDNRVK